MPIAIKEIRVNTVIEKKIAQVTDISDEVYQKMKGEIIRELSSVQHAMTQHTYTNVKKNER